MMKYISSLFLLILLSVTSAVSQIASYGLPAKGLRSNGLRSSDVPTVEIENKKNDTINIPDCLTQFAYKNIVRIDIKESGQRTEQDNVVIYRFNIKCRDAKSVGLLFESFEPDEDGRMFIYDIDKGQILGAFDKNSNPNGGQFATAPIEGDFVTIEYQTSVKQDNINKEKIVVSAICGGFVSLRKLPTKFVSQPCQVDAVCDDETIDEMRRSSVLIIVDGSLYCSGTLINNTSLDGEPLIMTSAHCFFQDRGKFNADLAKTCVFFFGYDRPFCDVQIYASTEKSISGASVVSAKEKLDMLILKMNNRPPTDYSPYYAGWKRTSSPVEPLTCYHHPSGDMLKVSREEDRATISTFFVDNLFDDNVHFLIKEWEQGITEGGSSGAPLYDADGFVVGALSGGDTDISCTKRGEDNFWRLDTAWYYGVSKVLDKKGTNCEYLEGMNFNSYVQIHRNICADEYPEEHIYDDGYAVGTNTSGITEYAEKYEVSNDSVLIYGVYFYPIVCRYNEDYPTYIRIYSCEDSTIGRLLYERETKVYNSQYSSKTADFADKYLTSMSYKENYLRFEKPLLTTGKFYVSIEFTPGNNDFALFHSVSECAERTSYYKQNGKWHSFSDHSYANEVNGIYLFPAVGSSKEIIDVSVKVQPQHKLNVSPNPVKTTAVVSGTDLSTTYELSVYNSEGIEIKHSETKSDNYGNISIDCRNFRTGIYVLKLKNKYSVYSALIIKE